MYEVVVVTEVKILIIRHFPSQLWYNHINVTLRSCMETLCCRCIVYISYLPSDTYTYQQLQLSSFFQNMVNVLLRNAEGVCKEVLRLYLKLTINST